MNILRRTMFSVMTISVFLFSGCISFRTSQELGLSYKTVASSYPPDLSWRKLGVAHELINIQEKIVVISGGEKPISDADWSGFKPPFPWRRNIERNLLFSETAFLHSPDLSHGNISTVEISGYTWVVLAKPVAVDYIPASEKTDILRPEPGHLVVKVIKKAQVLKWDGPFIYQLSDANGNRYVMHATESTLGPNTNVVLPAGWKLEKVAIDSPLIIGPFGGGDECWYNIVGDSLGQGYHQYRYSSALYPSE